MRHLHAVRVTRYLSRWVRLRQVNVKYRRQIRLIEARPTTSLIERGVKKRGDPPNLGVRVEFISAMPAAMNDIKVNGSSCVFIRTLQFVRLIDRHLRVLVAVDQ